MAEDLGSCVQQTDGNGPLAAAIEVTTRCFDFRTVAMEEIPEFKEVTIRSQHEVLSESELVIVL
jgi:hypothetical protein